MVSKPHTKTGKSSLKFQLAPLGTQKKYEHEAKEESKRISRATKRAPLGTQGTHVHEAKQGNTNRTEDTAEEANTNATTMEATTEATKTKSTNRTAQRPTKATKHTADSATVDFRRDAEEALRSYTKPTRAAGTQHTPEVTSTRDTTNTMAIEAEGLLKQWLVAHCQQR